MVLVQLYIICSIVIILLCLQFLPFPELIPFRMSPQITNVVLPHTASGKLKCCMVHTLRALRNSPRLLLNTMDVFVKEPSLDWKVCQILTLLACSVLCLVTHAHYCS